MSPLLYKITLGRCKEILNLKKEIYETDRMEFERKKRAEAKSIEFKILLPQTIIKDLCFGETPCLLYGVRGYEIEEFKFINYGESMNEYHEYVENLLKVYPKQIIVSSIYNSLENMFWRKYISIENEYTKSRCLFCPKEYVVKTYRMCVYCNDKMDHELRPRQCSPYEGEMCEADLDVLFIKKEKLFCPDCEKKYIEKTKKYIYNNINKSCE